MARGSRRRRGARSRRGRATRSGSGRGCGRAMRRSSAPCCWGSTRQSYERVVEIEIAARGAAEANGEAMSERLANETLEGTVLRVVYAAPDGAFAVVRLEAAGRDEPLTAVGPLGAVRAGETLELEGTWEKHPSHGDQFRAA